MIFTEYWSRSSSKGILGYRGPGIKAKLGRLFQQSICEVIDTCIRAVVVKKLVWAWTWKMFWGTYQSFEVCYWGGYCRGKCLFSCWVSLEKYPEWEDNVLWKVIKPPVWLSCYFLLSNWWQWAFFYFLKFDGGKNLTLLYEREYSG